MSEQIKEFIVTDVNENIKMIAIDIRIKHKLKLADALIAATAISLSIPLVTGDKLQSSKGRTRPYQPLTFKSWSVDSQRGSKMPNTL